MRTLVRTWSSRRRGRPIGLAMAAGAAALLAACSSSPTNGGNPPPPSGDSTVVDANLAIGESKVIPGDGNILKIQLPAASGAREYRVSVQSAAQTTSSNSMLLKTSIPSGNADVVPRLARTTVPDFDQLRERWQQRDVMELRLREHIRAFLRGRALQPARTGATGPRTSTGLRAATVPSAGDTIHFTYPIKQSDLSITCDTTQSSKITAVVRKVSGRAIFVADTGNSGAFSATDYQQFASEFDNYIFAIDSAYFGAPADIDGNGHVYVLFTKEVNALTPKNSSTFIGGFFVPTDLARRDATSTSGSTTAGTCPTSNEAEMLYLLSPDPTGTFSDTVSVTFAKENARSVSSHEFQHLLSAEDRVIKSNGTFNDLNDVWLDEGLSHIAEEIVGLAAGGHSVRQNLTFSQVTGNGTAPIDPTTQTQTDVFNTFLLDDFGRMARYFLNPSGTQTVALKDPGGIPSLQMRGFAWVFLRWLGDHYGPSGSGAVPGSDEQVLFQRLASGGASHQAGIDDVLGAVSDVAGQQVTWADLLGNLSIMPDVDDVVAPVSSVQDLPTWNLRDIFQGLHDNPGTGQNTEFQKPYPLAVTSSGFVADSFPFDVNGSAEKYFTFGSTGAAPAFVLRLTDPSGAGLAGSTVAQVTIVRTQ